MKRGIRYALLLLSIATAAGLTSAQPQANQGANGSSAKSFAEARQQGAKVFQANCGRCHSAPETLSPREVRAVLRQMRVRANLSAKDEKLLLNFLAP